MWNVKKYNKLVNIAKKETNPQMKRSSWLPVGRRWGRDNTGVGGKSGYYRIT